MGTTQRVVRPGACQISTVVCREEQDRVVPHAAGLDQSGDVADALVQGIGHRVFEASVFVLNGSILVRGWHLERTVHVLVGLRNIDMNSHTVSSAYDHGQPFSNMGTVPGT